MSQQQNIHVKLQHCTEYRRFIIEPQFKFNDLKSKISMLVHLTTPFSVCYLDEESEWITIDSDCELLTGIELSPALLRLKIEVIQAPTPSTIPIQVGSNPDVEGCMKWRKYKKGCRRSWNDKENDDTLSGEKDCNKWRKYRKESRNVCDKENDDTASEEKGCNKWRKYRKNCVRKFENDGTVSEEKSCKKWRKWRQENDVANDEESQKERREKRRERWGEPKGRAAWKTLRHGGMDNSDSDSIEENRPVEEIKKEINSLKEEVGVLVAKKKGIWEELAAIKTQIKTSRQTEGAKDEIVKLRDQIFEKKKLAREYHTQITNSKNRVWKLKSALVMKVDTTN